MKISIITLFPEMFAGPFSESIIKRATEKGLLEINFVNLRDFG
ncbi:MAG TPA: tRNA (guanosine(37)-N1)-methyltransferase TrmD, partial [Patescibacteria group bacterium]|nr:tRNA (guanosine(37)-N1)-methyltransferase TrmD [Patescibacteria group bacterium]